MKRLIRLKYLGIFIGAEFCPWLVYRVQFNESHKPLDFLFGAN